MKQITVLENGRLDVILSLNYPDIQKTAIKKFIADGNVVSAGKTLAKGKIVKVGEVLDLLKEPQNETLRILPNEELNLDIVFEDSAILAINKPAGIACHPNHPSETNTVANALVAKYPELQGVGDSPLMGGVLHRIDGETSGLVIAVKNQEFYKNLREQFKKQTVKKIYLALVEFSVNEAGILHNNLAQNPNCPGRIINADKWKNVKRPMPATTAYEPLKIITNENGTFTLLRVTIFTGVTHQIRAQLSFAGMPIIGDKRYGGRQICGLKRHLLHASSVTFEHPTTAQKTTLEAPLTADFQNFISS